MKSIVSSLWSVGEKADDRVSLSEIESRIRDLTGGVRETIGSSKQNLVATGVIGAVAFIAGSYLLGRRRGRRRATVLEIRRA